MSNLIKILVVVDEIVIAAKISMQLANLGYEVTGILKSGEEAIMHVKENKPDIVLIDIQLKGKIDAIDTAKLLQQQARVSIVYLTAIADDETFNRAKATKPAAFILKPFKQADVSRAIELAIHRMKENEAGMVKEHGILNEQPVILSDRIFIRCRDKMLKIMLGDILYIEADRNYSRIVTTNKEYLLSVTLKTIEEKLLHDVFVRIHRSYIVNLSHVDEVSEHHVLIHEKAVPLSSALKDHLMDRIQTL